VNLCNLYMKKWLNFEAKVSRSSNINNKNGPQGRENAHISLTGAGRYVLLHYGRAAGWTRTEGGQMMQK